MARMLPPQLSPEVRSHAERKLFDAFREGLSDAWTVLHSLGVVGHRSKPWAEIDFVLVGPPGVFCIEVKGGRVERHEGVWVFRDRFGHVSTKREGPFEQVGPAAAVVRKHLADHVPALSQVLVGYAVATPDVRFETVGVDVDRELVYDSVDAERPLAIFVNKIADYWRTRISDQRGRMPPALSPAQASMCVQALRPDFDLRPSLRARIGLVRDELLELTQEQFSVLDGLADNPRTLISGGAGTGKTLLAVEEAERRAAHGERVLYCCFNRHLAEFVRDAAGDPGHVTVSSIHALMALVSEMDLTISLSGIDPTDFFEILLPEAALEALIKKDAQPAYDCLILDELQDLLRAGYLDVLELLITGGLREGHWRGFYDPKQNLFNGSLPGQMQRLEATMPARFTLTINCRNTAPIGVWTGLLSGVKPDEVLRAEGPDVKHYWCRDLPDMRRKASRELRRYLSEGIRAADIVVLSDRRLENSCMVDGVHDSHIRLSTTGPLGPNQVRFASIQSFKGLEADVVLLVDVDDLSSGKGRAAMYVGASRARAVMSVLLLESARSEFEANASLFGQQLGGQSLREAFSAEDPI